MYMYIKVTVSRTKTEEDKKIFQAEMEVQDDDVKSVIHMLCQESASWLEFVQNPMSIEDGSAEGASSSSSGMMMAEDEGPAKKQAMKRLQEAFDTTTRLTLAVKRVALELVKALAYTSRK